MKTEDNQPGALYKTIYYRSDSVNKLTIRIQIEPGHPLFKGHFPGNPVLPGMVTIQLLKELLTKHLGYEIGISKASVIKYLNFIDPYKNNLIDFEIALRDTENGNKECIAKIHYIDTVFCTFKGEFHQN